MEYNGVLGEEMGQKVLDFLQALTLSPEEELENKREMEEIEEKWLCRNLKHDNAIIFNYNIFIYF